MSGVRKEFRNLISVEEAEEIVSEFDVSLGTEEVGLDEAGGRLLAEDVGAPFDVPPFARSLMDGYAVRAEDTYGAEEQSPVELEFAGSLEAGERPELEVSEGEAVEIATGAVLPDGADAVVMIERTDREGGLVRVRRAVAPRENVMEAGDDIPGGSAVVDEGERLGPREVGGLAAVGTEELTVRERPSVAVLSTGDELVEPGEEPGRGQIFDVNSYVLASALEAAGCVVERLGIVRDDRGVVEEAIARAAECDLILSSGSTSAGAADLVYRVVEENGETLAHGVKLKPGKPTILGRIRGTPFVGLPGNPASAYAVYLKLVDPFVRGVSGSPLAERRVEASMGADAKSEMGRHELRFVSLERGEEGLVAEAVEKVSGAVTLLLDADGYVEVPEGVTRLDEGESVEVTLMAEAVDGLGLGEASQ